MIESLFPLGRRLVRKLPGPAEYLPRARDLRPRFGRLAVCILIAGYLLFCHGCHGDEDHELFAQLPPLLTAIQAILP